MTHYKEKTKLPSLTKRYSEQEVLQAIEDCSGIRTKICNALDCTAQQLDVWLNKRPDRKEALVKAREKIVDTAEDRLIALLDSPIDAIRLQACKAVLGKLGRDRGWGGDSPALQVNIKSEKDLKLQINQIFGIEDGSR